PSWPLLTSWTWKRVRSSASAIASEAKASASTPSRRTGIAINAPSAPAATAPMIAAAAKLICPWLATKGTSMPKSWFTAQPATNPPAVTNVPCARLTMPPRPVTTTNDRKTMASAIPGARMPNDSKSLACAQPHGNHWSVKATNRNTKTAHGSTRRHRGRPARWSAVGFSSPHVTHPRSRVRPPPRAAPAPAVAPDHEQEDHGEEERDRGAEPGEIVEESGEDRVAVAVHDVLQDAEEQ